MSAVVATICTDCLDYTDGQADPDSIARWYGLEAKPSILWTAATAASKAVEYLESLSVAPVPAGLVSA